jgi:hypothetical protein
MCLRKHFISVRHFREQMLELDWQFSTSDGSTSVGCFVGAMSTAAIVAWS